MVALIRFVGVGFVALALWGGALLASGPRPETLWLAIALLLAVLLVAATGFAFAWMAEMLAITRRIERSLNQQGRVEGN